MTEMRAAAMRSSVASTVSKKLSVLGSINRKGEFSGSLLPLS